ncbi:hypothetical protein BX666DRAFT_1952101 [Dichotomocladium elegans]|nr:hypothetical protein BX666DRAFT_1998335 [Dichotomocladium elegans]KAI9311153.1 hypothetical protein BX666DRAFT_1998373 [Dichotomocladium elegans]KAI9315326.1 hypothetical protein BX666DRAFT_1961604 [Dichotomocladium elegans]KAI9315329.1 hypothetical protein BX666DRAFT_1961641 [Dichotomocladium elegans]KAI9315844.1 hypothetical protein BX666DRAFT_1952066 [Dichotomocladium elegans]
MFTTKTALSLIPSLHLPFVRPGDRECMYAYRWSMTFSLLGCDSIYSTNRTKIKGMSITRV